MRLERAGASPGRTPLARRRAVGDEGFGVVEVLAASVILMVIVISLSNLLVDSLSAALLSKQREQAASLASDVVENAKSLGQAQLSAAPAGSGCTTVATGSPVPVLTSSTFQQDFTLTIDHTAYEVEPLVTTSATGPDTVTVTVLWGAVSGQCAPASAHVYLTSTLVGTGQAGT